MSQNGKALDLLGRELKVGDHVVYSVPRHYASLLRHGFVTEILPTTVRIDPAPGQSAKPVHRYTKEICAIVLPDIQDKDIQLG